MRRKTVAKKTSILDNAKPLNQVSQVITALFYGRSGTGKTTLLGTFPKPLLVIDIGEKGTDSLIGEEGIDVIQVADWTELEEVYWELKGGRTKYKSVGIDALHTMQGMAITQVKLDGNKKETDQTSQRDFGQAGALMTQWCSHFRDLKDDGIQVAFLAHDRVNTVDTEDDEMINPEIGPRLMPAVASAITGMVNVVGNTYIREVVTRSKKVGEKAKRDIDYCLRIGPNGIYSTKVRSSKKVEIPEFIVDPTYDKLLDVINGASASSTKRSIRRKR